MLLPFSPAELIMAVGLVVDYMVHIVHYVHIVHTALIVHIANFVSEESSHQSSETDPLQIVFRVFSVL